MSLLEKASIVTTPTAYGVGVLNSIKPAQSFGEELVTNGNFSNGTTGWTPNTNATLSIDDGRLKVAISGAGSGYPLQNITTEVGKKYIITANAYIGTATKVSLYSPAIGFNDLTANGSYNLTFTATSTSTQIRLYVYGDGSYGFWDNVSVKKVTDADFQFSRTSSATRVNPDYLIETVATDIPRLDYTNGTASILLENQSTNLYLYSEPTVNESSAGGVTYESFNWTIGFTNCVRYGDNSEIRFRYGATVLASTEYTLSAFVIMDDLSEPIIGGQTSGNDFTFVLGGTVYSNANASIDMGNNIYRVSVTATTSASANSNRNGIIKYTAQSNKGFRVVGLQIEEQSYPTSYIPTLTGSTVTRAAETLNNAANSDLINSTEGVLYCEIAALAEVTSQRRITISDGTSTNRIIIYITDVGEIKFFVGVGGATQAAKTVSGQTTTNFNKLAISYKENDIKFYINGVKVHTDTSALTFPVNTLNVVNFAATNGTTTPFFGKCKMLAVFKEALSDTELACLTSNV